jgi:hypothetical protein
LTHVRADAASDLELDGTGGRFDRSPRGRRHEQGTSQREHREQGSRPQRIIDERVKEQQEHDQARGTRQPEIDRSLLPAASAPSLDECEREPPRKGQ